MKKDKDIYKLPSSYFEEFQDRLHTQIALEQELGMDKKSGFRVPQGYFDTLSLKLTQIPSNQEAQTKVVRLKSKYWTAISIAAAVLLLFGLFIKNTSTSSDSIELDDIAAYLNTESTSLYTEDILSLLTEEDLNTLVIHQDTDQEEEILNYLETYSNPSDLYLE